MKRPNLPQYDGKELDYIIVGGGTSGCVLANKLVLAGFRVLVVERGPGGDTGGPNSPGNVPGNFLKMLDTDLNWQYETTPQVGLNNRVLSGHRGTGLGGSSKLNFMSWVRGPKADFDDWAELVGDSTWAWENVLPHFKEMENLEEFVVEELRPYVQYDKNIHGYEGPISVGTGMEALPGASHFIEACIEAGIPLNSDHNSGNPIGVAVAQLNCPNGIRVNSAAAYLPQCFQDQYKSQLSILDNTICSRVLFESQRAIGVELFDPEDPGSKVTVRARHEIILTAGTFGSPHILLLSGIGDENHLRSFDVPVLAHVPGVGYGLQDHAILSCEYLQDSSIPSYNHYFQDPELQQAAIMEYESARTGPLVKYGGAAAIACPILNGLFTSPEFLSLAPEIQRFLKTPTRPSTEYWLMSGPLYYKGKDLKKTDSVIAHEVLLQNCQAKGTVKLSSADPSVPPLIDPNYLGHPYDVRMAIEGLRQLLKIAQTDTYRRILKDTLVGPWPQLGSLQQLNPDTLPEKTLEEFARNTTGQGLHAMSTCSMARAESPMGVVDSAFRVRGVTGLRVADISICPILTSNHTQVNAYLTGLKCADKILSHFSTKQTL